MAKLKVLKPFKVRLRPGDKVREFEDGTHDLTDEEMGHWFIQGWIKDSKAHVVADTDTDTAADTKAKAGADAKADADAKAVADTKTDADAKSSKGKGA